MSAISEFLGMVEKDAVHEVMIQGQELFVTDNNQSSFKVYAPRDDQLISIFKGKQCFQLKPNHLPKSSWFVNVLVGWLPMDRSHRHLGLFYAPDAIRRRQGHEFRKKAGPGFCPNSRARSPLRNVAGVDEAKEELAEIVEFLKEPKKFTRLGGRIPKGVFAHWGLRAPEKTLLARAIAGEAGVPFFQHFRIGFRGNVRGRGRFPCQGPVRPGKEKNAPCIIFIDEIDAVGRHRGAGLGGGHDEREQTLNQLLVEMDGFESNEGVILISATNRPDVLDPALLRPRPV